MRAGAGTVIDLAYGVVRAGLYLLLRDALPGSNWSSKGLAFGVMLWFLRVVMQAATRWVMLRMPSFTVVYTLAARLLEMLVLGIFLARLLAPMGSRCPSPRPRFTAAGQRSSTRVQSQQRCVEP